MDILINIGLVILAVICFFIGVEFSRIAAGKCDLATYNILHNKYRGD